MRRRVLTEVLQRGLGCGGGIVFSHHDAYGTFSGEDDLAVANFVLLPAEGMNPKSCAMDAQVRRRRKAAPLVRELIRIGLGRSGPTRPSRQRPEDVVRQVVMLAS